MRPPVSERKLVFLVGAGLCIITLDFSMVLPLGPDFAKAFDIPTSKLGMIAGSYTAAAAVAGIAGAFFLDRFDRRRALAVSLTGLALGTASCALATSFLGLLAARMIAGVFGGTAETIAYATVWDAVASERRGRATGAIVSSCAVASVVGLPAGLELARQGGWRAPFLTLAAFAAVVTVAAMALLSPQRAHLSAEQAPFREVLRRPVVTLALTVSVIGVMAHDMLVPNLSAYVQFNRGYPRERLGLIYIVGGVFVVGTTRLAGWLADRYGASRVVLFGTTLLSIVLLVGFIYPVEAIPVLVVFVGFMISSGFRFIPVGSLLSRIPAPGERARFLSMQTALDSFAAAIGAMLGAQILSERPDRSLIGIDNLAWLVIALTFLYFALGHVIERRVHARIPESVSAAPVPAQGS